MKRWPAEISRITRNPLYRTWRGMCTRCFNPADKQWHNYGGRGISVYPAWGRGFGTARAFIEWVEANIGPRMEGYYLDRIDNNGHYEPGNLRWVTARKNAENRRSTSVAKYRGISVSLFSALKLSGLNEHQCKTVLARLRKGMSFEQATAIYPSLDHSAVKLVYMSNPIKRPRRHDL